MKKKTSLRRFVALALTGVLLAGSLLTASAASDATSVVQEMQLARVASYAADPSILTMGYDQRVARDPQDLSARSARALLRLSQNDAAGARADLDTVLGQMETGNPLENIMAKMMLYPLRAEADFEICDQTQYLSDARAQCDLVDQYLNLMSQQPQLADEAPELAGQIDQVRAQFQQKREALQQIEAWYNNGNPSDSFTVGSTTITGGVNEHKIRLYEETGSEVYDTTFELSQPIWKVTRRCATEDENMSLSTVAAGNDGICYQVPDGTEIIMTQTHKSSTGTTTKRTDFGYKDRALTQLTIKAGKTYVIQYASSDSPVIVFTGV